MKILVTGASGFVATALLKQLKANQHHIVALSRKSNSTQNQATEIYYRLDSETSLTDVLEGIDIVIHLAARTHVIDEKSKDPWKAYAESNIALTEKLAHHAVMARVKRFIYISSVKVNGEFTHKKPFQETDMPAPEDYYGQSKNEAEICLKSIFESNNIEYVIIRPPLIYGFGVKANFVNLIKMCRFFIPLPFGAIHNKRSLIYLENLVDFIMLCLTHPKAKNQTFLVSDDDDVSTTQLIQSIRKSINMPQMLIPVPQGWLIFMFKLLRKGPLETRLCGNLQVDITKAKTLLGWKPPYSFKQGIEKTLR